MAAADDAERCGAVEESAAEVDRHRFAASVHQVGIGVAVGCRAQPDKAVFRMQDHVDPLRQMIGNHRGNADTEIDQVAVAKLQPDPFGD